MIRATVRADETAIWTAAASGDYHTVASLVRKVPMDKRETGTDRTLLHVLCAAPAHPALPDHPSRAGEKMTPDAVASLLVDAGADVDAYDANGDTPLFLAVENNHSRLAGCLVRAGAVVEARMLRGTIEKRMPDVPTWNMLSGLLNTPSISRVINLSSDSANKWLGAVLHSKLGAIRTRCDDTPETRTVISATLRVIRAPSEQPALLAAVSLAPVSHPVVSLLLAAGADPRLADPRWKRTALHLAVLNGATPPTLRLLVNRGGELDARDATGSTPLHAAYAAKHVAAVTTLLAMGANPKASDQQGRTPAQALATYAWGEWVVNPADRLVLPQTTPGGTK